MTDARGQRKDVITPLMKVVFLLSLSTLTDEEKDAWRTVLPTCTDEQVARLADVLEAHFLLETTRDVDEQFARALAALPEHRVATAVDPELTTEGKTALVQEAVRTFQTIVQHTRQQEFQTMRQSMEAKEKQDAADLLRRVGLGE